MGGGWSKPFTEKSGREAGFGESGDRERMMKMKVGFIMLEKPMRHPHGGIDSSPVERSREELNLGGLILWEWERKEPWTNVGEIQFGR